MDAYQDQQETQQLIRDLYSDGVRRIEMAAGRERMESPEERSARISQTKAELLAALAARWQQQPEEIAP